MIDFLDLSEKNEPIRSNKSNTIDMDSSCSALVMMDDTMFVIGNKNNWETIVIGAISMLPKIEPTLYRKIIKIAKTKHDEIFEFLSKIESRRD